MKLILGVCLCCFVFWSFGADRGFSEVSALYPYGAINDSDFIEEEPQGCCAQLKEAAKRGCTKTKNCLCDVCCKGEIPCQCARYPISKPCAWTISFSCLVLGTLTYLGLQALRHYNPPDNDDG
jgi:hypothetical protein